MTKRKLIDMFKNIIFPKQAEDLLKINYEGLGELDKREYLRDTSILIMLAEKGLKTEQEIVKPYLEAIEAEAIKYSGTGEREVQAYDEGLCKAIEIIKNLLSEQEIENDK